MKTKLSPSTKSKKLGLPRPASRRDHIIVICLLAIIVPLFFIFSSRSFFAHVFGHQHEVTVQSSAYKSWPLSTRGGGRVKEYQTLTVQSNYCSSGRPACLLMVNKIPAEHFVPKKLVIRTLNIGRFSHSVVVPNWTDPFKLRVGMYGQALYLFIPFLMVLGYVVIVARETARKKAGLSGDMVYEHLPRKFLKYSLIAYIVWLIFTWLFLAFSAPVIYTTPGWL